MAGLLILEWVGRACWHCGLAFEEKAVHPVLVTWGRNHTYTDGGRAKETIGSTGSRSHFFQDFRSFPTPHVPSFGGVALKGGGVRLAPMIQKERVQREQLESAFIVSVRVVVGSYACDIRGGGVGTNFFDPMPQNHPDPPTDRPTVRGWNLMVSARAQRVIGNQGFLRSECLLLWDVSPVHRQVS